MSWLLTVLGAVILRAGGSASRGEKFFSWWGLADCICIAVGLILIRYAARL